jgi:hypothetical protein
VVRMAKDGMEIAAKRRRLRAADMRRRLFDASASKDEGSAYAAGSQAEFNKSGEVNKEGTPVSRSKCLR